MRRWPLPPRYSFVWRLPSAAEWIRKLATKERSPNILGLGLNVARTCDQKVNPEEAAAWLGVINTTLAARNAERYNVNLSCLMLIGILVRELHNETLNQAGLFQ